MGSTVSGAFYISEKARLSKDILDLEKEVKRLKLALIDIKSKSTDIQFYGGQSENLSGIVDEIVDKVNKTLGS
tara:strand:- start:1778 stop:1996 length:219 start_codon:yes stop_codon:yes gene_type:complete